MDKLLNIQQSLPRLSAIWDVRFETNSIIAYILPYNGVVIDLFMKTHDD